MNQALKAEFRKLLSVRSTYVLTAIALILTIIASFYGDGFKSGTYDKLFLASAASDTAMAVSLFGGIVSVLLMAHEYRYNTVVYALTLNNSRSKVLAAKAITVFTYMAVLSAVAFGLSIGLSALGASMAGHHLPPQDFNALLSLGKSIFYCSGFGLAGLLFTVLLRNLTASIVVLFIVPNTIEGILAIFLKNNTQYLPFTALEQVIDTSPRASHDAGAAAVSSTHGALVFLAYFIIGWAIAYYLFLHRDAN
jgi:ABC-type transport system involved in multi-copper enzyme maturation permease subunit